MDEGRPRRPVPARPADVRDATERESARWVRAVPVLPDSMRMSTRTGPGRGSRMRKHPKGTHREPGAEGSSPHREAASAERMRAASVVSGLPRVAGQASSGWARTATSSMPGRCPRRGRGRPKLPREPPLPRRPEGRRPRRRRHLRPGRGEFGQRKLPDQLERLKHAERRPRHYPIRLPSAARGLERCRRVGRERNEAHEPALRTDVIAGRFGRSEPEPGAAMRAVGREFSDILVARRHAQNNVRDTAEAQAPKFPGAARHA
jgi:hypothetical protein